MNRLESCRQQGLDDDSRDNHDRPGRLVISPPRHPLVRPFPLFSNATNLQLHHQPTNLRPKSSSPPRPSHPRLRRHQQIRRHPRRTPCCMPTLNERSIPTTFSSSDRRTTNSSAYHSLIHPHRRPRPLPSPSLRWKEGCTSSHSRVTAGSSKTSSGSPSPTPTSPPGRSASSAPTPG